jgi:hypothetical protein
MAYRTLLTTGWEADKVTIIRDKLTKEFPWLTFEQKGAELWVDALDRETARRVRDAYDREAGRTRVKVELLGATYIGDGVYVKFAPEAVTLKTSTGEAITNRIVLEPEVWHNLLAQWHEATKGGDGR